MQTRLHRVGFIKPPYYMPKRKRRYYGNGRPRKRRRFTTTRRRRYSRRNMRTGGYSGIELKFADTFVSNDAFATSWATMEEATNSQVSGVAIGTGESGRIGRKYNIHSIHIKARVHVNAIEAQGAPLPDLIGRFCLILDKQTNGAQLTPSDVMDTGADQDFLAFRNLQHTRRFQVLWDKKWKLANYSSTNEGAANVFSQVNQTSGIMYYNKVFDPPIQVICEDVNATVADVSDNSLHIIGIANQTTAFLSYECRIRFTG